MTVERGPVLAAVLGSPVAHSRSPAIHNAAFAATGLPWRFLAVDVPAGGAAAALDAARAVGVRGLSVTMPLKEEVAGLVDDLEPAAARLGAVNCVTVEGDRLAGANTDGDGLVDALRAAGVDPAGRRCLVLGAGGAARAVVLALATAGAAEVAVAGRTPARVEAAAALAGPLGRVAPGADGAAAAADLVVNATPVGMGGDPAVPVDPSALRPAQVVVDLVYDPLVTPLLAAAERAGATPVGGLGTLVHQAAHAFRRWTGVEPPLAVMAAAAHAPLAPIASA
ncbi:MAG TPA: shikimate dehydrogenase [Acidimicrobiales bacterium]